MKTTILTTVLICALPLLTIGQDSTKFVATIKGEFFGWSKGDYLKDDNKNKSFGLDIRYFIKKNWAIKMGAVHSISTFSKNYTHVSTTQDTAHPYWGVFSYAETNKLTTIETNLGLEKYFRINQVSNAFIGINMPMKFDLQYEEQRQTGYRYRNGDAGSTTVQYKTTGCKGIGLGFNTGFNLHFNKHLSLGAELRYNFLYHYFDFADYTEDYIFYDLNNETTITSTNTVKSPAEGTSLFVPFGSSRYGNNDLKIFINLNFHF